jgi:nicotinate-nucleotide pyrophosphorylase (carboxylating)
MMQHFDLDEFIRQALAEDIGDGDHTTLSTIPSDTMGKARLLVKEQGIIAGIEIARRVFEIVDPDLVFDAVLHDGAQINKGDVAFYLSGRSASITTGERLALNIMQRMSGIATKTNRIQSLIADTGCKLLDTRKTTPGFRYFEKLAVKIGGGENHRFGLYDMILVKDNHVDFCGGVSVALRHVQEYLNRTGKALKVEVEARNLDEVKLILDSGVAFRILLDNFSPQMIREAVDFIHHRVETEASGGINESNVREYALAGPDYISMGALTHQINSLDLSLKATYEKR